MSGTKEMPEMNMADREKGPLKFCIMTKNTCLNSSRLASLLFPGACGDIYFKRSMI